MRTCISRRSLATLAIFTLCWAQPAISPGQEEPLPPSGDITIVLQGEARAQVRLAFPAPGGVATLPTDARTAASELEGTLREDLLASGIFVLQGPEELVVLSLTGDPVRDGELYRSLGNEMLLSADLRTEGELLVLEGRLLDLASGELVVGKRYRGELGLARRMAHTFADEIVLFLTGRSGVARTSIAFHSDRDGFKEVYLMDYDGRNQRRITAHHSTSLSPAWSPTGDVLAYVSYVGGAPGIYMADLATGRKQGTVTDGSLNSSPSFSPDGRRIAFSRSLGGNTEIFVVNRDGSGLRQLTHAPGIDTNPAWSPSGREIAFTSSRAGHPHLYVMDAEGANLRRVSFQGDYNDGAAWSPDGTRLVYASRLRGRFDLALTELVTLATRVLTTGGGNHEAPTFSPDGRRVAFTSTRSGAAQVWVMDLDGGNLRQLTTQGSNWAPDWSRQGR